MVTHIATYYEVRRYAWKPGGAQEERVYPQLRSTVPWQPVGTLAVKTIQRLERVAGSARPPRRMLADLARVAAGTLEWSAWKRRWTHRWRPPSGADTSRALAALAKAGFWRAVIVGQQSGSPKVVRRFPGEPGELLSFVRKLYAIGDTIRFRGAHTPRSKGRTEMALRFFVLGDGEGAVYLSAAFGVLAGRLWICPQCAEPFVTRLTEPRRRSCDVCEQTMGRLYARVRNRLNQRVRRKRLSPQKRAQDVAGMRQDRRRVRTGELRESAWRAQWDTLQHLGRPPKRAPVTHATHRSAPVERSTEASHRRARRAGPHEPRR